MGTISTNAGDTKEDVVGSDKRKREQQSQATTHRLRMR